MQINETETKKKSGYECYLFLDIVLYLVLLGKVLEFVLVEESRVPSSTVKVPALPHHSGHAVKQLCTGNYYTSHPINAIIMTQ